jgi:hypothetical protein
MIANELSPYGYRSPVRPPMPEDTLKYGQVEIGQTSFVFMLKANPRGRFLRITEKNGDAFGCLSIPDSGLEVFRQLLEKMFRSLGEPPAPSSLDTRHTLKTEQVQVERKCFIFVLDQGPRGSFLRIIEKAGTRSHELIILATGLEAFKNLTDEMVEAAKDLPVVAPVGQPAPAWTPAVEEVLKTGEMKLERKSFTFMLKKNSHGRFLRIIELKDGRSNTVIIPSEGLEEFKKWVMEMAKASKKIKD